MNSYMTDMLMRGRLDGRNPYGSEGGYVSSRPRRRDMARRRRRDGLMMDDMRRYEDGESDYTLDQMTRQRQPMEHDPYTPYGYYDYGYESDYARGGNSGRGRGGRDGHDVYPVEFMGKFAMPSRYDYARRREMDMRRGGSYSGYYTGDYAGDYGERLTREELHKWAKNLESEIEEKDRGIFSKENILKKAREMGIKFNEISEEEFYVTTLMMLTDYCKTLGTANMELYLKLAKDWLWDDDAEVKYGEKLAVYHDNIVEDD